MKDFGFIFLEKDHDSIKICCWVEKSCGSGQDEELYNSVKSPRKKLPKIQGFAGRVNDQHKEYRALRHEMVQNSGRNRINTFNRVLFSMNPWCIYLVVVLKSGCLGKQIELTQFLSYLAQKGMKGSWCITKFRTPAPLTYICWMVFTTTGRFTPPPTAANEKRLNAGFPASVAPKILNFVRSGCVFLCCRQLSKVEPLK